MPAHAIFYSLPDFPTTHPLSPTRLQVTTVTCVYGGLFTVTRTACRWMQITRLPLPLPLPPLLLLRNHLQPQPATTVYLCLPRRATFSYPPTLPDSTTAYVRCVPYLLFGLFTTTLIAALPAAFTCRSTVVPTVPRSGLLPVTPDYIADWNRFAAEPSTDWVYGVYLPPPTHCSACHTHLPVTWTRLNGVTFPYGSGFTRLDCLVYLQFCGLPLPGSPVLYRCLTGLPTRTFVTPHHYHCNTFCADFDSVGLTFLPVPFTLPIDSTDLPQLRTAAGLILVLPRTLYVTLITRTPLRYRYPRTCDYHAQPCPYRSCVAARLPRLLPRRVYLRWTLPDGTTAPFTVAARYTHGSATLCLRTHVRRLPVTGYSGTVLPAV